MEDEETLKAGALISEFADSVEDEVDDFLADGVVATSIVVGGVLLSGDELLGMEQLSVCTSAHLIDYGGFQVYEHGTGYVLAGAGLAEEGVETVITSSDGFV